MANPTEHAIEHAEHSAHAAHDPFERRVTITIAIVAAMLACSTMLGHRAHNQTLQLLLEANDAFANEADMWNQYQAKKIRQVQYEGLAASTLLAANDNDTFGRCADRSLQVVFWRCEAGRYSVETKEIQGKAEQFQATAKQRKQDSHHVHHLSDHYDFAELGVELGVVLCSLALLTKRKPFWVAGMLVAVVGLALMSWGAYEQFIAHPIDSH